MLLALAFAAQSFTYSAPQIEYQPATGLRDNWIARAQEPPRQGWLGVNLVIEDGHERPLGVSDVSSGTPAERGDVRAGDRLLALDGRPIDSYETLIEHLRREGPGKDVTLTVRRALAVELDDRGTSEKDAPRLGVHLGQLEEGDGPRWVVRQVESGWPAERAGVQAGDRIRRVAGSEPEDFDEILDLLAGVGSGGELELVIERDLHLTLGARPGETPAPPVGRALPAPDMGLGAQPDAQGRLRLMPAQPRADGADLERQLREEIAGLNEELRALREELRTLRHELSQMRSR